MDGAWSNQPKESEGLLWGRRTVGPIFLIASTMVIANFIPYAMRHADGSFLQAFWNVVQAHQNNELDKLIAVMPNPFDRHAMNFFFGFAALELAFMRLMPGKTFVGPTSPMGNKPIYKANGFQSFIGTIVVWAVLSLSGVINGGIFHEALYHMIALSNLFSFVLCLFLYVKGVYFPSSTDASTSGIFFFDFFAGVELYPRIFGFDVKQFTNCRFGMMFWGLAPLSYAARQYELHGFVADSMLVSAILQFVYVAKFFWWETGYFETIDIMHDKAGFMLCWGCLVWVPSLYTLALNYLVTHPVHLGAGVAGFVLVSGLLSVYLNYHIDQQRQSFRKNNGKIKTFGKPATFITAEYATADNKTHTSLLLTSGWWGICRKFNYTLELLAAFCWCCVGGVKHFAPWAYFFFLLILLVDRVYRDDARCRSKYGKSWDRYCKEVRYILIRGIY